MAKKTNSSTTPEPPLDEKYSELEFKKWESFQQICHARKHNMWINNECSITSASCKIYSCFAHQLAVLSKGFF